MRRAKLRALPVALPCLIVAGAMSACGPSTNEDACKGYVEARNQAYEECDMPDRRVDATLTCPPSLNEGPDCTEYYDKLADSFTCQAGEVSWDGTGSCT